jgi:hypothetical protein
MWSMRERYLYTTFNGTFHYRLITADVLRDLIFINEEIERHNSLRGRILQYKCSREFENY